MFIVVAPEPADLIGNSADVNVSDHCSFSVVHGSHIRYMEWKSS